MLKLSGFNPAIKAWYRAIKIGSWRSNGKLRRVGREDRRGHFRARQQLPEIGRDKIGFRFFLQQRKPFRLQIGDPDEVHHRMARGNLAAKQADAARAYDCEADALWIFSGHFLNGSVTGALLSAERSAAM